LGITLVVCLIGSFLIRTDRLYRAINHYNDCQRINHSLFQKIIGNMKRLNNLRILIVTVILTYNAKKNSAARSRIMNGRTARPRKGFFVHTVFLIYFLGKSKSKKFQQSESVSVISRLPIFFMTKQSALPIVKISQ